jgi:hypothetical protein
MEEKNISEKESLLLIQQMISTAKKEQKDDGMSWIIWGWMLFLASIFTVLNQRLDWNLSNFFFWNVFGGFTVVYFVYETVRYFFFKKTDKVKTYTGDLFARLNAGFFISLMLIIVSINVGARAIYARFGTPDITPINIGFALLINLYAFWILIYGTALNFRPSVIGAYCSWAIAFAALFVKSFEQVMLLQALAVLVGYIIPGHIANREFKKLKRKDKVASV